MLMVPALVIRTAKEALAAWRALPLDRRQALAADATLVTRLLAELAGDSAASVKGRFDRRGTAALPPARNDSQATVAALAEAAQRLSAGCAPLVLDAASNRSRTLRYGVKTVSAARKVNRWRDSMPRLAAGSQPALQGDRQLMPPEGAQQLGRVKREIEELGIKYFEAPPHHRYAGVGVAWSETSYVTVSCLAEGGPTVYLSCGILKDVERNAEAALQEANLRNRLYPMASVFIDGLDDGWDVLQQLAVDADALVESPRMLSFYLSALPLYAEDARQGFANRGLGGTPYLWNEPDLERLLTRTLP